MTRDARATQGASGRASKGLRSVVVSDAARGKRGTVRLDPSATVPEAIPAIRFAEPGRDLATIDRAELARREEDEQKPDPRRKNDRREFAQGVPQRGHRPTAEMRTVDVSRADPRQAPTQEVSRLPLVDRGYDPSREDGPPEVTPPRRGWMIGLALAVAGAIIAAYILFRAL